MVHHHVLGAVEGRVISPEVPLETLQVAPVRRVGVVGVDVRGEDLVEQVSALGVHRQGVEVQRPDD
jgi:hypothetical protein